MAIERNITADDDWFTGEDKSITDTIYQSDGTTAQNVTGWTITFMVKRKPTDADASALITKTAAITTGASGLVTVTITDDDTSTLAADTYFYEVKRTDAGFETVLTHGTCELRQAVHR